MREFREATDEDNPEIARISVEGWRYAYKGIMPDNALSTLNHIERAKGRSKFLEKTVLSTYVCVEDGRLLGFIDFELSRDDDCSEEVGEIWAIYLLPEEIGKYIGKELLDLASRKLAHNGCNVITVWVLSENVLARSFYERQGFVIDGREKEYQGLLEIRYRKTLESYP